MQAGQKDDELVTAQSRDRVDIAQLFFQTHGDALEQQVADRVAEAVVDVLEAVEVDKQDGPQVLFALRIFEGAAQAGLEQHAVG